MDTKFKQAALAEESPLNAIFCLPCSGSKQLGNKGLDVVQQCLPNIDAASCLSEPELILKAHLPSPPTEPGNLSDLFTSFVTEECLQIVAQLSNKSETCPANTPDALNPYPASNVSLLTEEPMPFDCSVTSGSEMSPTKSPQVHGTSKLTEHSLKLTQCQLINTEDEVKDKDNYFSDQYIDTETLPSLGNLIQFDETVLVSNPSDLVGNAPEPKLEACSRNVVRQSPTVINCTTSLAVEDLTTSDGSKVIIGASNMSSKNEFPDKSANLEKTSSNSKLSLSKTDLLLCDGSVLTDESLVVPMPAAPIDFVQSFAEGDLINLNETITLTGENATFDALKRESSFENDLPAAILPNVETSLSAEDAVPLNEVTTVIDKNVTFDISKHQGCLGNDQTTASTSCKLSVSTDAEFKLIENSVGNDCKNATFVSKDESAELVHDAVSSEWVPYCMSTPNVAVKLRSSEYPPLDHFFQTSSPTLQDDTYVADDCPDERVPKSGLSSASNENETKSSSGKTTNAPRLQGQLQKTKVVTASLLNPISSLQPARRKIAKLAAVSQEYKCCGEKKSIPMPAGSTRLGSSSVGRGGRPPLQSFGLSKMCLPKPRQGKPSCVGESEQSAVSNELPCQTGGNSKIPTKAEPKVNTRLLGVKKRSPWAPSIEPAQEPKKSDSKPVQLFNLGTADPPSAHKGAHKPCAFPSKNVVTGIKRPGTAVEQKRQCPSPKRSKAVGEKIAKLPKKSGTKVLLLLDLKQKGVKAAEKLTSETIVKLNKTPAVKSDSKQELEIAELQRKIKELEEKIVALELENASLRQKESLTTGSEENPYV